MKIISKKRKTQKKPKETKEIRQVSKKINTTINLWCSRKMSPASRTFLHRFLADTGAEVTPIPLSLVNKNNLLTTPDIPPYKVMGVNGAAVKTSEKAILYMTYGERTTKLKIRGWVTEE